MTADPGRLRVSDDAPSGTPPIPELGDGLDQESRDRLLLAQTRLQEVLASVREMRLQLERSRGDLDELGARVTALWEETVPAPEVPAVADARRADLQEDAPAPWSGMPPPPPPRASPSEATVARERPRARLVSLTRPQPSTVVVAAILLVAGMVRLWQINALGFNSDEAVYAGQAAAVAEQVGFKDIFPVFRAHPMLFQYLLGVVYLFGVNDLVGRLIAVVIGLATIYLVFRIGKDLYGEIAGRWAAVFMAAMPYTVIVSRQVLLDGPMTLCATTALFALSRFVLTRNPRWLYTTGVMIGLTFLAKEGGVVLVAAAYVFLALTFVVRVRVRDILISFACMAAVVATHPLSLIFGGGVEKAQATFIWQLFREANHDAWFYLQSVPPAMGWALLLLAVAGLLLLRRSNSWREVLLLSWIVVPVTFFQLWPVKGFQYLLPTAPAVALLAARVVSRWRPSRGLFRSRFVQRWLQPAIGFAVVASLLVPTWDAINYVTSERFLAGSGGVPAGREAGRWIEKNLPGGARLMTIGPSMANILKFYGHHDAWGLSVSPNPLHRNPSYDPIKNPDRRIRTGQIQYLVWDAYSAERSTHFANAVLKYKKRYGGRVVHTETVEVVSPEGATVDKEVIVVYEVQSHQGTD